MMSSRPFLHASLTLLALVAFVMLSAELLSRYAFPRISNIERRIRNDESRVMTLRSTGVDARPTVLLAGNSLLLMGLDYPHLNAQVGRQAYAVRFVIENTEYLDWYYGLHHLFASGVRPSIVVLCLNVGQTVSSRTLGDYSARHLFGASDLLPVAHAAGMDATQTSELLLSHWSAFYASRATMRNFILNRAAPGYATAMHNLADNARSSLPPDDEVIGTARARLDAIDSLCRQFGAQLVLLIPPSLGGRNELLASAAQLGNVNFDYPLPTLNSDMFRSDGTHLNQKGAAVFTQAIARCLQARLAPMRRAENLAHSPTNAAMP